MPKKLTRKKIQSKNSKKPSAPTFFETYKKRSLVIGGVVVLLAALILLRRIPLQSGSTATTNLPFKKISTVSSSLTITQKLHATPTELPKPTQTFTPTPTVIEHISTSAKASVKRLPFTAGEPFAYTVAKHDTLYTIGKVFCNSKASWIDLAMTNKIYAPYILHAGDTLIISCE